MGSAIKYLGDFWPRESYLRNDLPFDLSCFDYQIDKSGIENQNLSRIYRLTKSAYGDLYAPPNRHADNRRQRLIQIRDPYDQNSLEISKNSRFSAAIWRNV